MSFDTLKQSILKEADARIEEIKARTRKQLRHEEKRITKQAQALEQNILDEAEKYAEQAESRLHQERQLQAKANVLTSKQLELDKTEAETLSSILKWEEDETRELLKALIAMLPDKPGIVLLGEKHTEIAKEMLKDQKQWDVSEEVIPDDGGLKFRDEKMEINLSVRYLVRQLFTRHRADIARHLFN
jgi:vacuolar-type H+-ATPase subunit E/Vma4